MRLALLALIAGCSMYGAPADRLATVHPIKPPKVVATPDQKIYNEDCTVEFNAPPARIQKRSAAVATQVDEGDAKLNASTKATTDQARADLVISGIGNYRNALRTDPYDPDATLHLARAYDAALHKGCALAMLKRLGSLEQNPKLAQEAVRRINDILVNPQWFRDYRKAALAAVNR